MWGHAETDNSILFAKSIKTCSTNLKEVVQRPIAKPVSAKFHISIIFMETMLPSSLIYSVQPLFYSLGSSCFARWYEIRRLYCVCTSEWRLIKVDAQLTPRIALESCSRSWSKISAIPCRNSGLIGKLSFVCI